MPHIQWNELPEGERAAVQTLIDTDEAADDLAAGTLFDNGNSGSSKTVSLAHKYQKLTLTASAPAITLSGLVSGKHAETTLLIKQDATGSRLLPTFSPALDWGTPGAPTLTTTAAKTDIVKLTSYDGVNVFAVLVAKGY